MPYNHNTSANNITDAPAQNTGASEKPDEPIKHNRAITNPGKKAPFYLRGFFCLCVFSLICLVLLFVFRFNSTFSEWFSRYISGPVRMCFTAITSIIPFSLAESIIIMLIPGLIAFFAKFHKDLKKDQDNSCFKKYLKILVAFILLLFDTFALTIAPCYYRAPLAQNLGIQERDITPQRLENACSIMVDMLNRDASEIYYGGDGQSHSRSDFDAMSKEILNCFDKFCKKYNFIFPVGFRAKQIALSEPMTYLHISGVYTYFTGEANINVNYPDYILPHTIAHEMSHARGVFNEGDANFVGFLVCLESDSPYVRYSGLMNIFTYVADALYSADRDAYVRVMSRLSYSIYEEFDSFSVFFEKYSASKAAVVSGAVNDTFLKANGQTEGINSYGLVVDLTVNYLEEHYGTQTQD